MPINIITCLGAAEKRLKLKINIKSQGLIDFNGFSLNIEKKSV